MVALLAVLAGMVVPQTVGVLQHSRARAAARHLAGRMALARSQAVSGSAAVALRFEEEADGIAYSVYADGNRNGVRSVDIQSGVDRRVEPPVRLWEPFPGVAIAKVPDADGDDPVQVGASNLLTFAPGGTATSGTIYLMGQDGTRLAIRVLGATGRTRVLRYDAPNGAWLDL